MYKVLLYLPALVFFGFMGLIYLRSKRNEAVWDLPFKDDQDRPPGESLRLKLDDLYTDLSADLMLMFFAAILPFILLAPNPSEYLVFLVFSFSFVGLFLFGRKIWKRLPIIRSYRIGFEGERITAQNLTPLFCRGYYVFHDIPMGDYNVDHVVVGPNGVFAIESKARRKRKSAGTERARVVYDGRSLHYPEVPPETYGLEAAVSRAQGLEKWLSSAVGEKISVWPILALPGWYVQRTRKGNPPVMNPKSIPNFILKTTKYDLSEQQIKRIRHQLFEKSKVETK